MGVPTAIPFSLTLFFDPFSSCVSIRVEKASVDCYKPPNAFEGGVHGLG